MHIYKVRQRKRHGGVSMSVRRVTAEKQGGWRQVNNEKMKRDMEGG